MYNPEEECKQMIDTLKKICKYKNMTPYALARQAGISTSTISYLMNGKTKPQIYTILVLCNVLGITVSDLFRREDIDKLVENYQTEVFHISYEEKNLVKSYRYLSEEKKELLKLYIDMLLQYNEKEKVVNK